MTDETALVFLQQRIYDLTKSRNQRKPQQQPKHPKSQFGAPKMSNNSSHSVSFHPIVAVRDSLHVADYTDEELESCWYSRIEARMMKIEIRNTITLMKLLGEHNMDRPAVCARGLEAFDTIAREEVIFSVLVEQEWQVDNGIKDADRLAHICSEKSAGARFQARMMGVVDQKCASEPTHKNVPPKSLSHFRVGNAAKCRLNPVRRTVLTKAGRATSHQRRHWFRAVASSEAAWFPLLQEWTAGSLEVSMPARSGAWKRDQSDSDAVAAAIAPCASSQPPINFVQTTLLDT